MTHELALPGWKVDIHPAPAIRAPPAKPTAPALRERRRPRPWFAVSYISERTAERPPVTGRGHFEAWGRSASLLLVLTPSRSFTSWPSSKAFVTVSTSPAVMAASNAANAMLLVAPRTAVWCFCGRFVVAGSGDDAFALADFDPSARPLCCPQAGPMTRVSRHSSSSGLHFETCPPSLGRPLGSAAQGPRAAGATMLLRALSPRGKTDTPPLVPVSLHTHQHSDATRAPQRRLATGHALSPAAAVGLLCAPFQAKRKGQSESPTISSLHRRGWPWLPRRGP